MVFFNISFKFLPFLNKGVDIRDVDLLSDRIPTNVIYGPLTYSILLTYLFTCQLDLETPIQSVSRHYHYL